MSFFSTLKSDFEKLFGKSPTYVHFALSAIQFAAPVVETILAVSDPAAGALVAPIITRVEAGLATAYSLASEGTASGATLGTTLSAVQADLASLESVAGIKDANTQAKIATVLAEITQVVAMIPAKS